MSDLIVHQAQKLAETFGIKASGHELVSTLKATAFKGQVTDAQMVALLVVANQYGLNPFTKELFAFPDKNNGIVPVVGVDGWSRIINTHPQFDGMDFEQDAESCTCIIYRKDRSHPIRVTEWMEECKRGTQPWQSHPKRMLRHKAMIQCARIAFGFAGIYDQDEAERIAGTGEPPRADAPATPEPPAELLQAAHDAAANGTDAYAAFWKAATKEDRKLLAQHHPQLKEKAEKAVVVNAETGEIEEFAQ